MMEGSPESPYRFEQFPGWNLNYDLSDLVGIIRPFQKRDLASGRGSTDRVVSTEGSLLAGKKVVVDSVQEGHQPSALADGSSAGRSGQAPTVLAASRRQDPTNYFWLLATTAALAILAFGFWWMMWSSDYSGVDHIGGAGSKDVQLWVEPGETLPDFTGHLLVEGIHEWNGVVSTADLYGKNTVMLVWGSGNTELPSWSQALNQLRLVYFDASKTRFVGLNLDTSREDALAVLNEDLLGWPHIFNYSPHQASTDHPRRILGIEGSPMILLIDATGRLRAKGLKPEELVEACRSLFE